MTVQTSETDTLSDEQRRSNLLAWLRQGPLKPSPVLPPVVDLPHRDPAADRAWANLPPEDTAQAKRVRDNIDEDLAWFLECGDSVLGARGTLGGIINALEMGGHTAGGVPLTDLYNEAQIGWGRYVYGEIERHRWLLTAWLALEPATKGVLLARYTATPAQFRADGWGGQKKSVHDFLGDFGCLALMLVEQPGALIVACNDPDPINAKGAPDLPRRRQHRSVRANALKVAREASLAAHAEWAESKAGADKMRSRAQRVAVTR